MHILLVLFCVHILVLDRKAYWVVPEKIHTHLTEGHQKFLRGGVLKSQNFISKV